MTAMDLPRVPSGRRCPVCAHESRAAIDQALLNGKSARTLAAQFGFHYNARSGPKSGQKVPDHKPIAAHRDKCMGAAWAAATKESRESAGRAIAARLKHLDAAVTEVLADARKGVIVMDPAVPDAARGPTPELAPVLTLPAPPAPPPPATENDVTNAVFEQEDPAAAWIVVFVGLKSTSGWPPAPPGQPPPPPPPPPPSVVVPPAVPADPGVAPVAVELRPFLPLICNAPPCPPLPPPATTSGAFAAVNTTLEPPPPPPPPENPLHPACPPAPPANPPVPPAPADVVQLLPAVDVTPPTPPAPG